MLQEEHSAILLTLIKLPFVIKIFVLSIFEGSLKTGFTVYSLVNKVFHEPNPPTPKNPQTFLHKIKNLKSVPGLSLSLLKKE